MHRGGKQRRDGTGQPEQTGVVSTSPLTNCDTTSCHTRLNSAVARSRSTGNKLMFARRIWVVWRFSGDTYSRVQSWACTYTRPNLSMTRRRNVSKYIARRYREIFDTSEEEKEEVEDAIRARDGRPSQHLRKSRVLDAIHAGWTWKSQIRFPIRFKPGRTNGGR